MVAEQGQKVMKSAAGPARQKLSVIPGESGLRRPLDYDLFLDCVHCGLCSSTCPTYLETGQEADNPRGRIYLMRAVTDGRQHLDSSVLHHLDLCLDCRACESACPSGVQYGELIERFRINLAQQSQSPRSLGLLQRLILFHITPSVRRTRLALAPVRFLQWSGIDSLMARWGMLNLLPPALRQLHDMVPRLEPAGPTLPEVLPAAGRRRCRVALFTGCAADAFFPSTNWAAARALQHNGCEVWIPRNQVCCGALHYHAARAGQAADLAAKNCRAFAASGMSAASNIDAIVVTAAGCGAMLKAYGDLLGGTAYQEAAASFAPRVKDVAEFLSDLGPVRPVHPLPMRAVYHDACHLCHAQQIRLQPRRLLEMIPGLELVPLAETEICCGAAGSYSMMQPDMAQQLGRRKAANILNAKPEAVFAANVGCLLHIGRFIRAGRSHIRLHHPIDALWASYSGQVGIFSRTEKT
jgi:glycolate oxidase iron-sulfur subunit